MTKVEVLGICAMAMVDALAIAAVIGLVWLGWVRL